jgi:hypothetical protein
VTDAGLEHLRGLTQLQSLSLHYTKVTDAGFSRPVLQATAKEKDVRANRVTLCVLAVCLGGATLTVAAEGQPADANDQRAIRAVIEKINFAMKADAGDKGEELMRGVISEKGYTIVVPKQDKPTEAFVGDKKALLEIHSKFLRDGSVHRVQQIVVVGPIAYEIGETSRPDLDAKARGDAWLNVFAKEDGEWKLVFGTPADDFQKAVRQLAVGATKPDAGPGKKTGDTKPEPGKRLVGTWIGKLPAGEAPGDATVTVEFKADGKVSMAMPKDSIRGTWKALSDSGDKLIVDMEFEKFSKSPAKEGDKLTVAGRLKFSIDFENTDRMTIWPTDEPNDKLTFDRKK